MLSRKGGILIGRDNGFRKNGLRERDGAEPRAGPEKGVSCPSAVNRPQSACLKRKVGQEVLWGESANTEHGAGH